MATDTQQQVSLDTFLASLKPDDRILVAGSGNLEQIRQVVYEKAGNLSLSPSDANRLYNEALDRFPYQGPPQASQSEQERRDGRGEGFRELAGGLIEAGVNRKSEEDKLFFEMKQEQTEKLLEEIDTKFSNKTVSEEEIRSFLTKLESDNLLGENVASLKQRIETVGNATNIGTTQITKPLEDRFTEQKAKRAAGIDNEKKKDAKFKAVDELDYENLIKQLSDEKLSPDDRRNYLRGLLSRQQGFAFQRLEDILTLKKVNILGFGRVSLLSRKFAKLTRQRIQKDRQDWVNARKKQKKVQPTQPIQLIQPEQYIIEEEPQEEQVTYATSPAPQPSGGGGSNIDPRSIYQNAKRLENLVNRISKLAKFLGGTGEAAGAAAPLLPLIAVVILVIVVLAIIALIFILVFNGWMQQNMQNLPQQNGVPIPGLHLNLTTNPPGITSYQNGQNVSFVVDVTYQGTYSVLVTDSIPQNANVIPNTISGKNNFSNNSVTWSLDANSPLPNSTSTIKHWQFTLSFAPTGKDLLLTNNVTASYAPGSGPAGLTVGGRYGTVQTHDVTGGVCSPTNLAKYFGNIQAGTIASCICKHESGGDPGQINKSCNTDHKSADWSVGLFQINQDTVPLSNQRCTGAFSQVGLVCKIADQKALDRCDNSLLDPTNNINAAVRLYHASGNNFDGPWHADRIRYHCF